MAAAPQDRTIIQFELSPRTIVWVLAVLASVWVAGKLWEIALLVVVAFIFAGTFSPMVKWLERHGLGRTLSLLLLFLASLVVASALIFLTVPPLLEQLTQIVRSAPASRLRLITFLQSRNLTAPLANLVQSAELEETFTRIEGYLLESSSQVLKVIGYFGTAVVLSFYALADGKRTQGVLYAVVPRAYHMRLARIVHNLETIVGGYMRGQFLTSAAIGLFTFALLLLCKVPHALSLALVAALADAIPLVGGLLAAGPAVLSALSHGVATAVVVASAMFVYMEFENRVLIPKVYGQVLRLSPIMVVVALLAGTAMLGMMGALLALPIAAGLQMILEELRVELPGDDSVDQPARARDAKIEATYERLSAGSTAPEAGQIASNLEQRLREPDTVEGAK